MPIWWVECAHFLPFAECTRIPLRLRFQVTVGDSSENTTDSNKQIWSVNSIYSHVTWGVLNNLSCFLFCFFVLMDAIILRNERKQACQQEEQRTREPGENPCQPSILSIEYKWPHLWLCLDTLGEKVDYFLEKPIPLGWPYFILFFFKKHFLKLRQNSASPLPSLHRSYLLFLNLLCKPTQNRFHPLHVTGCHGILQIGRQCSVHIKDSLPLWGTAID